MPAQATIIVELSQITDNTEVLVSRMPGIDIVGVTKATCGSPEVAQAMLDGGATAIGDSRIENIARLREAGIEAPLWLLRSPTPGLADDVVRLVDISVAVDFDSVKALERACKRQEKKHSIMVMVDLGDRREGMMPEDLPNFLDLVSKLPNIEVAGIGTSLTCWAGVKPDAENLGELAALAAAAEEQLDKKLIVSGGNSSSYQAAVTGIMPEAVNSLRIGESILLGVDTLDRMAIPGLRLEAVRFQAPVVEIRQKPTKPRGEIAQNAFGEHAEFEDRGWRWRALLAAGQQDIDPDGIVAIDGRVRVLGATSDHLIVDVDVLPRQPVVGESYPFIPNYSAMLRAFTSPYVKKEFRKAAE